MKKLIALMMTLGLTIVASSNLFAAVGEADESAPVSCDAISSSGDVAAPAGASTVVVQPSGVQN